MGIRISDTTEASVKGSFALLVGNLTANLVMAVGSIIVARMLEPSEYGLYLIALVLPSFFNLFSTWGIQPALTRFIARHRSRNSSENIENIIQAGFFFRFVVGSILSIFLFLSSNVLATTILRKPEVGEFVRLSSVLILAHSVYGVSASIFTGYENMKYRAMVKVFQSIIKGVSSPLFVYWGFGVGGVIIGHTISYVGAALLGFILVIKLLGSIPKIVDFKTLNKNILVLLKFGFPLFIGNLVVGISNQFRGFLFSWYVQEELVGNYGIASWFNTYVGVLTLSLGATLLPTFSKFDITQDSKRTKDVFRGSIRYSTIFLLPIICLFMFTSKPIIFTLFREKYPFAPLYLSLLLAPTLLVSLGSLSIPRFLNSQAETRATMIINLIGSLMAIFLNLVFLWIWNIEGLLISLILSSLAQNLLGRQVLRRKYDIKLDLGHAGRMFLCCFIAGGVSLLVQYNYTTHIHFLDLVIYSIIFIVILLLLTPNLGVITRKDVDNIDFMFKNLHIVYPFVQLVLSLIEKIRIFN